MFKTQLQLGLVLHSLSITLWDEIVSYALNYTITYSYFGRELEEKIDKTAI